MAKTPSGWSMIAATVLVLSGASPVHAQRIAFVDALVEFHSALFGTYGDEGAAVTAALDRMAVALDRWDVARARSAAEMSRRGTTPADRALYYADHLQLEAAVTEMKAAIAAEPSRAPLHVYLGWLHDALGQRTESIAAFRTARVLAPSDPVAAYLVGLRGIEAIDPDAAHSALEPIVATLLQAAARGDRRPVVPSFALVDDLSAPTRIFATPGYEEGFRRIVNRQFHEAVAAFRAAVASDPLVADPAVKSGAARDGIAALRARRGAAATKHLQEAVRDHPGSSETRRVLGIVYRANGRLAEARASFEAAVKLAPSDERSRVALGSTLMELGKLDEAERVLLDTIKALPSSGEARWALSEVYERLNLGDEAVHALEDAASLIVVAGKSHLLWRIAQVAHLYHRDYERVIDVLAQRVRVAPNEPHTHKDLALAYLRAGRDDESLIELLMTTLLGYEDAETLTAMGQIHLRQERLALAETVLARAVQIDPKLAETRYALARTLRRLGRATEAAQHLDAFNRLRQEAFEAQRRTFERESSGSAPTGLP